MKNCSLVIGVGNESLGDDALGLRVVEQLRSLVPPGVELVAHRGESLSLIDAWQGYEQVILVDALAPRGKPGSIHKFEVVDRPLPRDSFAVSSHSFGVPEAVELARSLNKLPKEFIILGVEANSVESAPEVSKQLQAVLPEVVAQVLTLLDKP